MYKLFSKYLNGGGIATLQVFLAVQFTVSVFPAGLKYSPFQQKWFSLSPVFSKFQNFIMNTNEFLWQLWRALHYSRNRSITSLLSLTMQYKFCTVLPDVTLSEVLLINAQLFSSEWLYVVQLLNRSYYNIIIIFITAENSTVSIVQR